MSERTFAELGVSPPVIDALAKRGIVAPFKIQTLVMDDALAGKDVLAKSRTGSGKTLAFAIPIVQQLETSDPKPSAVVLVPTRELAVQVTEETADLAAAQGLKVASVYGGVDLRRQAEEAARAHILIATPGRLEDLVTRKMLSLSQVKIFILDEADRMLDMGFLPQVNKLVSRIPKERQTMFFSATLDGQIGLLAQRFTRDPARHEVESAAPTVEEVAHRFIMVTAGGKVQVLADVLTDEDRGLALVFVRTKRGADRLVDRLKQRGVKAVAMHGDLTQAARQHALAQFDGGKVDTLIATDVAARGLDLDDITHVINFDPPDDDKSYVHRVGRTARAGRSGLGVTLVMPDQRHEVSRMADRLKIGKQFEETTGHKVAPPMMVYSSRRGRRRNSVGARR